MNKTVILLGGNVGNTELVFQEANVHIDQDLGRIVKESSVYRTDAWGVEDQPAYLNQVIVVETNLSPQEVLAGCLSIEKKLGRDREEEKRWHSRILDLDVLFYENEIINTEDLIVPHPRISERNFVLVPLSEIMPEYLHPVHNKTIREILKESSDKLRVSKI